jgi:error-prone DNA polymerase
MVGQVSNLTPVAESEPALGSKPGLPSDPRSLIPDPPSYCELHAHSSLSLLDGASQPEELAERAAALGMPALALTDHNGVYAAPRFVRACREYGVRPLLGAELTLADGTHLTLLVEDETGWHNLCYLISRAHALAAQAGERRAPALPPAELVGCTQGLIALSGCRHGAVPAALLADDRPSRERALAAARHTRDLFGDGHFYVELHNHLRPGDERLVKRLAALASYLGLPTVATNDVHYATRDKHRLQDVLVCIQHNLTLDEARPYLRTNSEYYLKDAAQMAALFAGYPEALANTMAIAERCRFTPQYGLQDLPVFPTPHGMSSTAYLRRLCMQALDPANDDVGARQRRNQPAGAEPPPPAVASPAAQPAGEGTGEAAGGERVGHPRRRFPAASPLRIQASRKAEREQLERELALIEDAGLANYFLIVGDMIRFAREAGIRCQGRGSAANSLVAYLLGISPINPLAHDLVFERFLSEERIHGDRAFMPDVDVDFDAMRREEVIQYLYEKYGEAHTAMACTFVTFRLRSALRDVGKALGVPPAVMAAARVALELDEAPAGEGMAQVLELARQLHGLPRHLGIHAGGMILTGAPLMGRVPTQPAAMPGRVVVQWDKEGLEDAGLVKIDVLGLRMLSAIDEAVALIAAETGAAPDLHALKPGDPAVYAMLTAGDTVGIFQVESRAQAQLQPQLRPNSFADLVVSISLIRPGPIQGEMVHPYLRRRAGVEPVAYAHPLLEPVLRETLGVILYQEQVLKVAAALAGFTGGQGELLRRALGAKEPGRAVEQLRERFLAGAAGRGVSAEIAGAVFDQLKAFGGYAFAKSHAAAFAVLVYQSAWLKQYHLLPFFTALLNNQPMGFWPASVLVNEVKRKGGQVLPVDIHASQGPCTLEGGAIRLGFNVVKGMGEGHVARIERSRAAVPFASLADFWERTRLARPLVENLIRAGALDGWGLSRRQLLWELGSLRDHSGELPLPAAGEPVELPPLSPAAALWAERAVQGLSAGEHPLSHLRPALRQQGVLTCATAAATAGDQTIQVAGLLVVHQSPPTANGHHFLTLEDETGLLDVVVRPAVYARYRRPLHTARLLVIRGLTQRQGERVALLARALRPLLPPDP